VSSAQGLSARLDALLSGEDLDAPAAESVMDAFMSGETDPVLIAGILMALRAKGESPDELAGLVRGMQRAATPLVLAPDLRARAVDTCGTGGDGAGTINVSTIAALVVAANDVPVIKHGNRAASSQAGSADLLEQWGVTIELPPEQAARVLDEVGITFLFARAYHPAMRHVAPVRSALGVRTVFNLLGPLSSPAGVMRQVIGVPDERLGPLVAETLVRLGHHRALVVRGDDGLDELTTTTTSRVWEVRDGSVSTWQFDPASLGLEPARPEQLRGGDVARNRELADLVLDGGPGPLQDLVALNAAAALLVADAVEDLAQGLVLARRALDDGAARALLARWVERSGQAIA